MKRLKITLSNAELIALKEGLGMVLNELIAHKEYEDVYRLYVLQELYEKLNRKGGLFMMAGDTHRLALGYAQATILHEVSRFMPHRIGMNLAERILWETDPYLIPILSDEARMRHRPKREIEAVERKALEIISRVNETEPSPEILAEAEAMFSEPNEHVSMRY
jgi:hypothetical protein